jgi:hypothetical protein
VSLSIDERLRRFCASAPQNKRIVKVLSISHSAMSQTFHLWREPYAGAVTDGAETLAVQPVNFDIKLASDEGTLDQQYTIQIDTVDINDEFVAELDRIGLTSTEKIVATYREYLSDDLTAPCASVALQVESVARVKGAASLSAVTPRLNVTRTGEIYSPRDVPMLRGFL